MKQTIIAIAVHYACRAIGAEWRAKQQATKERT